jgi:hypothetical protein
MYAEDDGWVELTPTGAHYGPFYSFLAFACFRPQRVCDLVRGLGSSLPLLFPSNTAPNVTYCS